MDTAVRLRKMANAYVFSIPKLFCELNKINLGDVVSIKIKVEGMEYPFLKRTITQRMPTLIATVPPWFIREFKMEKGNILVVDIEKVVNAKVTKTTVRLRDVAENSHGFAIPKLFCELNKINFGDVVSIKIKVEGKEYPFLKRVVKHGGSYVVIIPTKFLEEFKMKEGDILVVDIEKVI